MNNGLRITLEASCLVVIGIAISILLSGCNTVPTRRVHAAASVPRYVDVNTANFSDGRSTPVGANAGIGHGIAFSDVGNVHDATIFHAGVNYRSPNFAAGFMPFLGSAHIQHEGTGVLGSMLWLAVHFGGGDEWKFSYQNSFAASNKTIEDKGCENDRGTFFTSNCAGSPQSSTRAEVKLRDVGFILTAEKRVNGRDSVLIAPSIYWTWISTSNKLDVDPAGNFGLRTHFWSPGLQVGYTMRFGERFKMLVTAMAGAHSVMTFRTDKAQREWMPTADVRFQF